MDGACHGDTPLHVAVRASALRVIELFLQWGASSLATNQHGESVLDVVPTHSVRGILLAHEAALRSDGTRNHVTDGSCLPSIMPLMDPARYAPDPLQAHPQLELFWAAHEDNHLLAERALQGGATLHSELDPCAFPAQGELHRLHDGWPYSRMDGACHGDTPLHVAVRASALRVIELFLQWGASSLATNQHGESVLDVVPTHSVRGILLAHEAALRSAGTRIQIAAWASIHRVHATLQQHTPHDLDLSNPFLDLFCPTPAPVSTALPQPVEASLPHPPNPDTVTTIPIANTQPYLEWFWGVKLSSRARVEGALISGADVDAVLTPYLFPCEGELHDAHNGWPYSSLGTEQCGDTAAHIAARTGDLEVLELIVSAGADLTITNERGERVVDVATPGARHMIAHNRRDLGVLTENLVPSDSCT
eukprot:TRINITY_DN12396_c0_g1_i2.p1 TRINITY_DN12396_c0_g1~~TRINITY_DN12396_c0_g1_i2.p1  ORF type:complete len:421 (+),score=54.42 TRINITY_DN12396_c0_g1_i2:186-1448(+)